MQLVSFDLESNFGFFRKPETNNTLNVSYNMIHKPALLGILGAIIGLKGYQKKGELPEYYQKLCDLKIGIAPLEHDKGNFSKTAIKYSNTVGYANKGTTFLTEELTLVSPKYRIYLLLDEFIAEHARIIESLEKGNTEYIPYFGKNEFTAWWDKKTFRKYDFEKTENVPTENIEIKTLFKKEDTLYPNLSQPRSERGNRDKSNLPFIYFERLPIGFNLELMQYELKEMVFTNYNINSTGIISDLYNIEELRAYVQLN